MIREELKNHMIGINPDFRHRGVEPGRLENFSDAVFALAITLLLISTSPPTNFDQVKRFVWELIPFSLCIVFIVLIWHEHFTFFFRYGLRNAKVVVLNSIFLIIVLFYVYPLKFLTKLILLPLAHLVDDDRLKVELFGMIKGENMADLMIIYGLGAFAVFMVLMLMYRYAYKQADALQLNAIERFDTQTKIKVNQLMALVPLISVAIAIVFNYHWVGGMLAGFAYFLYTPIMFYFASRNEKARQVLLASLENDSIQPENNT
jgi:uncharacterized membrane protein